MRRRRVSKRNALHCAGIEEWKDADSAPPHHLRIQHCLGVFTHCQSRWMVASASRRGGAALPAPSDAFGDHGAIENKSFEMGSTSRRKYGKRKA